jgi:hypothetical protein
VLEQRQAVKHRVKRLAPLTKLIQRPGQVVACPVQVTGRGELSRQHEARARIEAQIGSGALELDGAFHRPTLDASTQPELDASERGQALRKQGAVTCAFSELQGTACVVLGRSGTSSELQDVGHVCVEGATKSGVVLGMVERIAETLERSIGMDRVLEHVTETQENLRATPTAWGVRKRFLEQVARSPQVADVLLKRCSFEKTRPVFRTVGRAGPEGGAASSAATPVAPRTRASITASSSARATSSSGPVAAAARCRARSSMSRVPSASPA